MAGGGTSSPDKFGNGHQFIAAVFQSLHNGVHRRHRRSVNVMHQNDGAGFGAVHGAGGHHGGAGLAPVIRVHIPHDRGEAEALAGPGRHACIRIAAGGAHDHGDNAAGVADGFISALELGFRFFAGHFAQINVIPCMVAYFMPLIDHAAHYLGMSLHIAALHEESTLDVIVAQDVQHPGGQRSMGTVIKGEGHHLVRHSHTVDRYPRNARGKRSIIIGRAYGRHRNGLGRQFHGRPVRLFPRSSHGRNGRFHRRTGLRRLLLVLGTGGHAERQGTCKE